MALEDVSIAMDSPREMHSKRVSRALFSDALEGWGVGPPDFIAVRDNESIKREHASAVSSGREL